MAQVAFLRLIRPFRNSIRPTVPCDRAIIARYHANNSKYIFSEPSTTDPKLNITYSNGAPKDNKHFFTQPPQKFDSRLSKTIGDVIASQRRKRRRSVYKFLFYGIAGVFFGYFIGYRTYYLGKTSFVPLFPSSRIRKLSDNDKRRLDIEKVKNTSKVRVLEQLSKHEMIKDKFSVPLQDENGKEPRLRDFTIWCEDQDPCVTGITLEPDVEDRSNCSHRWFRIPGICKLRMSHRSFNITSQIHDFLTSIGLVDVYHVLNSDKSYGSFKYEYPLQGDNHSLHIWFLGEMNLSRDAWIIYKGKYHVDVELEEVYLLQRQDDGQLVRYMIYKKGESVA